MDTFILYVHGDKESAYGHLCEQFGEDPEDPNYKEQKAWAHRNAAYEHEIKYKILPGGDSVPIEIDGRKISES